MTRITINGELDRSKLDVLLSMINSWNIEAEVEPTPASSTMEPAADKDADLFAETRGMWADRDITDKELRALAWGTDLS
ncbi:MAG: hypothetical protein LBD21_08960 [Tannerellaceae bacterium]|nr:hypothetical protein [Tannerellaceae bacterium]